MNQYSQLPHNTGNPRKGSKRVFFIALLIILLFFGLLKGCGEKDHNDGKCDICGKPGRYGGSGEEYCEQHFRDAVEYYLNH